ncbi:MAG: purine-binding chemotaxis protein CheW [Planctomycetes bacterium]|nr:purine-binding chemotaxis protein CheW [Planctomycetota bacterium]
MNECATQQAAERRGSFTGGRYLSFRLGGEEYGIAILKVREIIGMVDVTPLPRTPDFVRGVINLRGKIIPVVDLRRRFEMQPTPDTPETCIVVVDVGRDRDNPIQVGCLVDAVSEVIDVAPTQFEATPRCANAMGEYLAGLGKLDDRVLILLEIERVLGTLDPALVEQGS